MRVLVARCSIGYSGRLTTRLASGDRIIIFKDDGSVCVHGPKGFKPINYMSGPTALTEADGLISVRRPETGEVLLIEIEQVISDATHGLEDTAVLEREGRELELHALLERSPELIEAGLEILERERSTDVGPVDFLAKDAQGRIVLVEVKRVKAVVAAVEHYVFDALAELWIDLLVYSKLPRVDNTHVHAVLDSVVEKAGVHGLAHVVVAAKAKAHVGDPAAHLGIGQILLDPGGGLKKVKGVAAVLLHARGDGEYVGVKNDVFGREAVLNQKMVGSAADFDAAIVRVCLALLVKGHDDYGGTKASAVARLIKKLGLARLKRDGVYDRLALYAF